MQTDTQRDYWREYRRQWRLRNPERQRAYDQRYRESNRAKLADQRSALRSQLRSEIQTIKLERGCADCGYNARPEALDFDHRPGETKLLNVSTLVNGSRTTTMAEIEKCDVVCANCHRVRTAERLAS